MAWYRLDNWKAKASAAGAGTQQKKKLKRQWEWAFSSISHNFGISHIRIEGRFSLVMSKKKLAFILHSSG